MRMMWPAAVTRACPRRLEVSEFLNDSLVDFALKRLQEELARRHDPAQYEVRTPSLNPCRTRLNHMHPQRKFHFFNCFFFKKLLSDEVSMRYGSKFGTPASRPSAV